jgi:hypothetical protein
MGGPNGTFEPQFGQADALGETGRSQSWQSISFLVRPMRFFDTKRRIRTPSDKEVAEGVGPPTRLNKTLIYQPKKAEADCRP